MKLIKVFLVFCFMFVASAAYAGQANSVGVVIDLTEMFAEGDMRTVRNSDSDLEFIGCGIRKYDDGAGEAWAWGFCQAQDANEVFVSCYTESEYLMDALAVENVYSYIVFTWNENFDCTYIGFSTQSFYLPKTKK